MDAAAVREVFDGLERVWIAVGPLVGGLLGAWLTARHQRGMEEERRFHASQEAHRVWLRDQRTQECLSLLRDLSEMSAVGSMVGVMNRSLAAGEKDADLAHARDIEGIKFRDASDRVISTTLALQALGLEAVARSAKNISLVLMVHANDPATFPPNLSKLMDPLYGQIHEALGIKPMPIGPAQPTSPLPN